MAIRIPDVPDLQPTQINAPPASDRVANAPAEALGAVASSIAGVGAAFQDIADRTQRAKNAEHESKARIELSNKMAELQQRLDADPEADRVAATRDFFTTNRSLIENPDYSPAVRERLGLYYDEQTSRGTIRAAEQAANITRERAGMMLSNEIEISKRNNDPLGFDSALSTARHSGIILPEQEQKLRLDWDQDQLYRRTQEDILADPAAWLRDNPASKVPAGFDPVSWDNQRNFAQSQLRDLTYQATSDIQDGMATGAITTPEQIDTLGQDLRPQAREQLKQALAQRALALTSTEEKARINSPEYKQWVVGQVSSLLGSYDPEDDQKWDADFVEMDRLIRTLPTGAEKAELTRQIKAVRKGEPIDDNSPLSLNLRLAQSAFKGDYFGRLAQKQSLGTLLGDGFLSDRDRLLRFGFDEDQTNKILGEKWYGSIPSDRTDKERMETFRSLFNERKNPSTITPFERAVGTAIRENRGSTYQVEYTDPRDQSKALSIYGNVVSQTIKWSKANPDATVDQIRSHMLNLAAPGAADAFLDSAFEFETSMFGEGLLPPIDALGPEILLPE